MFQGYNQSVKFQAPFRGIDSTVENNIEYAKYLENLLVGDNNTCVLRYGTRLIAQFPFDEHRIFTDQIAVMSYLRGDGKSEKIVYQNYLTVIPYIDIQNNVTVEGIIGSASKSRIIIDITPLTAEQKAELAKNIFEGLRVQVRQESVTDENDIENVFIDLANNIIRFDLNFKPDFFDKNYEVDPAGVNNFTLWYERGGLYKLALDNSAFNLNPLLDDLDPNVLVSAINYMDKLIIANGVDKVQVYDGENVAELKGKAPILIQGQINYDAVATTLTFNIPEIFLQEAQKYVTLGANVIVVTTTQNREIATANIVFAAAVEGVVAVTLALGDLGGVAIEGNLRTILYKKDLPAFSFINVVNDRLWALPEGRSKLEQFREGNMSSIAYYASDRQSVDGWFNQRTNTLNFIPLSAKSPIPDNTELILAYQGKTIFLGRETLQIWSGEDPTIIDDGQNIAFPDFNWEMTLPVGVIQRTLCVEIPNNLVFLSKIGVVALSSINKNQQFSISYDFSSAIDEQVKTQLMQIASDRDYRNMRAFLYPYGRIIGFKLRYNCLIYQLKTNGAWTIFTQNFADCRSFFYDPVSRDLFLGMSNGALIAYADKFNKRIYEDWGWNRLYWTCSYNWIYPSVTWYNQAVFLACRSFAPIKVSIYVYTGYNDADDMLRDINVKQVGASYDVAAFGNANYAHRTGQFPYEILRFSSDAIMIKISGHSDDQFIFDKLLLTGGAANAD